MSVQVKENQKNNKKEKKEIQKEGKEERAILTSLRHVDISKCDIAHTIHILVGRHTADGSSEASHGHALDQDVL